MCVVALALGAHPCWPILVAANRDERHDRSAAPLAAWPCGILAGRDLVTGGTWLGLHPAGRFAALTNIRHDNPSDPGAPSRGALVPAFLRGHDHPGPALAAYNPFTLLSWGPNGGALRSNRTPSARRRLGPGIHLVGNASAGEGGARSIALRAGLIRWLAASAPPGDLFDLLAEGANGTADEEAVFRRDPIYGTRCSTIVAVGADGRGSIAERRYDAAARAIGDVALRFVWPAVTFRRVAAPIPEGVG